MCPVDRRRLQGHEQSLFLDRQTTTAHGANRPAVAVHLPGGHRYSVELLVDRRIIDSKMMKSIAHRFIKVNHAGEFGAINIYRAQILVGTISRRSYVQELKKFLTHEKRHLSVFSQYLSANGIKRCKSYWLCGMGGFTLGLLTALMGKKAIMACTSAVETAVLKHLNYQLVMLDNKKDTEARASVLSIIADESEHRDSANLEDAKSVLYRPIHFIVAISTGFVIWLGMKL